MRALELALSEDQAAMRDAIAGFLAGSRDRGWSRVTEELELTGLAVPEALGGTGATWMEVCIALEEMGRASYAGPYLSTVGLAQSLLMATAGGEDLLRDSVSGRVTASVALTPAFGGAPSPLAAHEGDRGWTLSGATGPVLDGATAAVVLAALPDAHGTAVFGVDPRGTGAVVAGLESFDVDRSLARLTLDEAPCRRIGGVPPGALEAALMRARVALACEQVGGLQACLEAAVAYAGARRQFGRAIGSFQAIKHRCADMLVAVESARALADEAVEAVVAEEPDAPLLVAAAAVFCSEAFLRCAGDCIQIHGAVGFTWEQGVHRFYRRAIAGRALLGSPHEHRTAIAAALLGER
jgi:alkylation response protein AidB-like acyl-CoA dehydrogenase